MLIRLFAIAGVCSVLIGCVSNNGMPPDDRPIKPFVSVKNQICETKLQCEMMWAEAQNSSSLGGMRIRIATDSRIETFAPTNYDRMGFVVEKYPVDSEKYEIRPSVFCYRNINCKDIPEMLESAFNRRMELTKIAAQAKEKPNLPDEKSGDKKVNTKKQAKQKIKN